MMHSHTKRTLDAAVDELKRDGYMVLVVMLDKKKDESNPLGSAVEVLCSETNDPKVLQGMLQTTLSVLSEEPEIGKVMVH